MSSDDKSWRGGAYISYNQVMRPKVLFAGRCTVINLIYAFIYHSFLTVVYNIEQSRVPYSVSGDKLVKSRVYGTKERLAHEWWPKVTSNRANRCLSEAYCSVVSAAVDAMAALQPFSLPAVALHAADPDGLST